MKKLDDFNLLLFLKNFRILTAGDIPAAESLKLIAKSTYLDWFREYLNHIVTDLENGGSIAEALFNRPHPFPQGMARAFQTLSEKDFGLENILANVEVSHETGLGLPFKKQGALTAVGMFAPIAAAIGACLAMLAYVGPVFGEMFSGFGAALPGFTQAIISSSLFVRQYWPPVVILILIVFSGLAVFYSGILVKRSGLYHILSIVRKRINKGDDVRHAFSLACDITDNSSLQNKLMSVVRGLDNGQRPVAAIKESNLFPDQVANFITGDEMRDDLAVSLEAIQSYYLPGKIWSPEYMSLAAIIIIGCFMALLAMAMYMPIFGMAGAI